MIDWSKYPYLAGPSTSATRCVVTIRTDQDLQGVASEHARLVAVCEQSVPGLKEHLQMIEEVQKLLAPAPKPPRVEVSTDTSGE